MRRNTRDIASGLGPLLRQHPQESRTLSWAGGKAQLTVDFNSLGTHGGVAGPAPPGSPAGCVCSQALALYSRHMHIHVTVVRAFWLSPTLQIIAVLSLALLLRPSL